MAKVHKPSEKKSIRPALTPEAREKQLISLAIDLVEQRLLDGTASSQETTHFLKLATQDAKLKREKLQAENDLMKAKTEALQAAKRVEELYGQAIAAMRRYSGHSDDSEEGDEDDEY